MSSGKRKISLCALLGILGIIIQVAYIYGDTETYQVSSAICDNVGGDEHAGLLIGIVGDSWIADSRLDDGVRNAFAERGLPVLVKSKGAPSAKTSKILVNNANFVPMLRREYANYKIIQIIEGGINDSFTYVGKNNYAQNVSKMVDMAISCHAYPVVLTIPYFDRHYTERPFWTKLHWGIARLIAGDDDGDNAEAYNATVRQILATKLRDNQVTIIDMRALLPKIYSETLYKDGVHPPMQESDKIGKMIGDIIVPLASQ